MILGYHPGIRVLTQNQVRRECGDWMMWIWGSNFEKVIELAGLIPVIWIHLEVSQVIRTAKWSRLFSWAVLGLVTRGSHEILAAYNFFFEHIGIRKGVEPNPTGIDLNTPFSGSWTDHLIQIAICTEIEVPKLNPLELYWNFRHFHLHIYMLLAMEVGGHLPSKERMCRSSERVIPCTSCCQRPWVHIGFFWISLGGPWSKNIYSGVHGTAHCFFKDQLYELYAW